jgi:hypothetical protein
MDLSFLILMGFFLLIFIVVILKVKGKGGIWKDFKMQTFEQTVKKELNLKFDTHGKKIKGRLYSGFYKIGKINKYFYGKGQFTKSKFNIDTKQITTEPNADPILYNFLFIRTHKGLFGIRKGYYIIDRSKEKEKEIVNFDEKKNNIYLGDNIDIHIYGGVWIFSEKAVEYINDISHKRMYEQTMMHLENLPDKVAHLEMQQAKRERSERISAEIERQRWEGKKSGDDTVM